MALRALNTRIEIWATTAVDDGYGGTTPVQTKLTTTWAKVQTAKGAKYTAIGLQELKNPIIVNVRYNPNRELSEGMFIVYRGNKYIIQNIEHKDFDHRNVELLAVQYED